MGNLFLREVQSSPPQPNVFREDISKLHRPEDDDLVEYFTTEYTLQNALGDGSVSVVSTPDGLDIDTLHRKHGHWLIALLRRRVTSQDAEDLAQDTYVRALDVETEIHNPRAFLAHVAKHAALDQYRQRTARDVAVSEFGHRESLAPALSPTDLLALKQAILTLPPKIREVFLLSRIVGLTYVEIANRCGISVVTVQERMTKASAMISALMRD
jgi:RNA polymerase sigma factor (sigma-70 family)